MKKIDLNIEKDDFIPKESFTKRTGADISKEYILIAFQLYQNQQKGLALEDQRKIYKISDDLDNMKSNILELEDDRYEFLKKVFEETKWIGGTKIIVRLAEKIDNPIPYEKGEKPKKK